MSVERHPDAAARRRVLLGGVDTLKILTPGYGFKAEFEAGRIVLGSTPILHIHDGMFIKASGFDLSDVLKERGWNPVPLYRR